MGFVHAIAFLLVVKSAAAFERKKVFENKVKSFSPTAKLSHTRTLQQTNSSGGTSQCGVGLVSEWINQELQPRTCMDLPLDAIALPICQQYENIKDISECQSLTPDSVGFYDGGIGDTQEECELFFSALQPNPYFRDVDNLNNVFGSTGSFPVRHECYELQGSMCELTVVYAEQDGTLAPGETSAPTPAPYTIVAPCTRCDYFYEDDEYCFNADCNLYQCNQNNDQTNNGDQEASVAPENHSQNALIAKYHKLYHNNSTEVSCPGLKNGEVDCQSCLKADCAAAQGQCLVSCLFVPDGPCWSHEIFTQNTTEEVCHAKAEMEADADICGPSNITDCATCTSVIKSDGISPCEWYYSQDGKSSCGIGGCDFLGMCGRKTCDVEPTEGSELGKINPFCDEGECVGVCFKSYRSDLFSFREDRRGEEVGCSMRTELKSWITEFHRGSTNVRKLEFKIGERYSSPEDVAEDEGEFLDYCELSVDGVACSSCSFCGPYDPNNLNIDCTNIVPDAVTDCGSLQDLYYGIVHKLLVVEDGATQAPTVAPTEGPIQSPNAPGVQLEKPNGGGGAGSETDELIGLSNSAARVSLTMFVLLGTVAAIMAALL